ncbi:hypothetical protein VdG1_00496 [Verticillium dahliae VDG1]|nr:hypothetical protein VdG1_00496 [Verticillium dahliae VDG1]
MATLYIGNKRYSSWSMRPWVLMKALNIPFDEKIFFFAPTIRQPAFDAFSPSGKTYGLALSADADAYARRLLAHPAVAQWVAEGLAETARCEMHEADVVRDGRKIVEDLCK